MYNWNDDEDNYNYSPNELADLAVNNPCKYREIVRQNIDEDDTVEQWERRNLEWAQKQRT